MAQTPEDDKSFDQTEDSSGRGPGNAPQDVPHSARTDAVLTQRPATRAWTRLVQSAKEDAAVAAALREDAARHMAAANAAAARRTARRAAASQRKRPLPYSPEHHNADRIGEGQDVAAQSLHEQACVVTQDGGSEHVDPSGGVEATCDLSRNDGTVTRPLDGGVGGGSVGDGASRTHSQQPEEKIISFPDQFSPTSEDFDTSRPWTSRVEALERFAKAISAASGSHDLQAELMTRLTPDLSVQLKDLRSKLVVAAADAIVPAAPACRPEQALILLEAAFTVVIKTKAVMSEAGSRVAKAIMQHQPPDGPVWKHLLSVLAHAPHAKTRLCAAECMELLVDMPSDVSRPVLRDAVAIAVQDKTEETRAAGRGALAKYEKVHGRQAYEEILASLPEKVRARATVAPPTAETREQQVEAMKESNSEFSEKLQISDNTSLPVKSTPSILQTSESEAPPVTNAASAKPRSVKEMIQLKRQAMKQQRSDNGAIDSAPSAGLNDTQDNHNAMA